MSLSRLWDETKVPEVGQVTSSKVYVVRYSISWVSWATLTALHVSQGGIAAVLTVSFVLTHAPLVNDRNFVEFSHDRHVTYFFQTIIVFTQTVLDTWTNMSKLVPSIPLYIFKVATISKPTSIRFCYTSSVVAICSQRSKLNFFFRCFEHIWFMITKLEFSYFFGDILPFSAELGHHLF